MLTVSDYQVQSFRYKYLGPLTGLSLHFICKDNKIGPWFCLSVYGCLDWALTSHLLGPSKFFFFWTGFVLYFFFLVGLINKPCVMVVLKFLLCLIFFLI